MHNIILTVGTRPEYTKMWPIYKAFEAPDIFPKVVATGQHHDILKQQQKILYMPIDDWLLKEQPHTALDGLFGILYDEARHYLNAEQPDIVFVVGDTTSATTMGLAAFHLQIPVAHVEAGLRSDNLKSPYPEELNRITLDALSTYLFAPTERRWCHHISSSVCSITFPIVYLEEATSRRFSRRLPGSTMPISVHLSARTGSSPCLARHFSLSWRSNGWPAQQERSSES